MTSEVPSAVAELTARLSARLDEALAENAELRQLVADLRDVNHKLVKKLEKLMAKTPTLTLTLDKPGYDAGDLMTLRATENIGTLRTFAVTDSTGTAWTQTADDGTTATFTATAVKSGAVTVKMNRPSDVADVAAVTMPYTVTVVVEPPSSEMLIGASCGNNDGGLNAIADIRRCFNQGGLPSSVDNALRSASERCRDGGVVWTSYKGSKPSDSSLRTSLKSISDFLRTKHQTGWVTYEHEPDIKDGVPTSTYHAGYDQLEKVIAEFDNLQPIVCLTGFTGDKDPGVWEDYYRPDHVIIGFDHYNKGHQRQGEPMCTPAENYGPLLKWSKSKGKKVAIGETGVGDDAVPGPVIKTREQWYSEARKFVLDPANGIVGACAFDSGLALLSPSEAKAWYGK